jgi:hypothetical protein
MSINIMKAGLLIRRICYFAWGFFSVKICGYATDFVAGNIYSKDSAGPTAACGCGEKILCTTTSGRDGTEKEGSSGYKRD